MKPETKQALNRVIASAFNGSGDEQKQQAVNNAFDALDSEKADEAGKDEE